MSSWLYAHPQEFWLCDHYHMWVLLCYTYYCIHIYERCLLSMNIRLDLHLSIAYFYQISLMYMNTPVYILYMHALALALYAYAQTLLCPDWPIPICVWPLSYMILLSVMSVVLYAHQGCLLFCEYSSSVALPTALCESLPTSLYQSNACVWGNLLLVCMCVCSLPMHAYIDQIWSLLSKASVMFPMLSICMFKWATPACPSAHICSNGLFRFAPHAYTHGCVQWLYICLWLVYIWFISICNLWKSKGHIVIKKSVGTYCNF